MIVFCEDCGERNIVDLEEVKQSGQPVRCRSCNDILRISLTQTTTAPPSTPAPAGEESVLSVLELKLGDHVLEINQTRPTVTMGRQEHNDLEVIDTRVSRSHARIEYRKGRFFLIDHSTNGTYMMTAAGEGVNLKRSEIELEGSGVITLGRKVSPDSPKIIHFTIKTG
jgi:hypothetical protein